MVKTTLYQNDNTVTFFSVFSYKNTRIHTVFCILAARPAVSVFVLIHAIQICTYFGHSWSRGRYRMNKRAAEVVKEVV